MISCLAMVPNMVNGKCRLTDYRFWTTIRKWVVHMLAPYRYGSRYAAGLVFPITVH